MFKSKIFLFCMILFSMFLPMATAFADLVPDEKSNTEVTYNEAVAPVCVVMVIVKVEEFVPFIRIIDSRIPLENYDYVNKTESVTLWKGHLRNYLYESSGGDLPVKL